MAEPPSLTSWEVFAQSANANVLYTGDSVLPTGDKRFLAVVISKLWEL